MFENLLVTSMDRDTASGAHPAFVSMIPQLTPDEAWILKSIDRTDYTLATVRAGRAGDRERLGFERRWGASWDSMLRGSSNASRTSCASGKLADRIKLRATRRTALPCTAPGTSPAAA